MNTFRIVQRQDAKTPSKTKKLMNFFGRPSAFLLRPTSVMGFQPMNSLASWRLGAGFALAFFVFFTQATFAGALDKGQMVDILKGIDTRIRSGGDYTAVVYIEQHEKDKPDVAREALVYRRDLD